MKDQLQELVAASIGQLKQQKLLKHEINPAIIIEHARNKSHGDFACNVALTMAKQSGYKPRELAELIINNLPESDLVKQVEVAGPGFINFYLSQVATQAIVETILAEKEKFGRSNYGQGQKVLLEFVSANPTGPLHVGHGRGAAYGATLSDLLTAIGYDVDNEYYVNDAGRQMNILAVSIWLRYLELNGMQCRFPNNGYRGDYIYDLAQQLKTQYGNRLVVSEQSVFSAVVDINDETDKEGYIDALIQQAKQVLKEDYQRVLQLGLDAILTDIREDLEAYGVHFDCWFSEQSLMDSGAIDHALERLTELGFTYEKEGATWFKAEQFGDDKDRVLKRQDGRTTYFASDVAYHLNKVERGYALIIDVLGADHHGYVARVRAAMRALGVSDEHFIVPLVQFASLYRQGHKVQMSTRSGSFVTLRELREEIGKDAARFFYVMRKVEQHMDFDLDLAKSSSNDNPVYYIQYAHARICSVMRQLEEKQLKLDLEAGLANLSLLQTEHENDLFKVLSQYPDALFSAAIHYEPHGLVTYLRTLATHFHTYYNAKQFLVDNSSLRNARIALINAVRQVLVNALELLSVSAPETM